MFPNEDKATAYKASLRSTLLLYGATILAAIFMLAIVAYPLKENPNTAWCNSIGGTMTPHNSPTFMSCDKGDKVVKVFDAAIVPAAKTNIVGCYADGGVVYRVNEVDNHGWTICLVDGKIIEGNAY